MNQVTFTSDDVRKTLLQFSLPMIVLSIMDYLGMFISLGWLMTLSDVQQLPATFRIAIAVNSLLEALFGGLLAAIYIFANQAYGRRDYVTARYLINFGFGVSVIIALLIFASGNFSLTYLITLFDVQEVVKQQVLRYLNIIWCGYLAILLHLYVGLLARMAGAISLIKNFKIIGFLSGMLLTPAALFIAQVQAWDALQATAMAAIASRLISLAYLAFALHAKKVFPFRLGFNFLPRKIFTEWRAMLKLGGAETLNAFSLNLSFYLLFLLFSYYEAGTLEAVTISQYMTGFFQTVMMGVITTIIPFVAQNAGANKMANVALGVRWMSWRVFIVSLALMLPFMLIAPHVIEFFIPDANIANRALDYIYITSLPWAFLMASFPFLFAVIGLGDTRGTLLLTIWSMYLCSLLPILLVRLVLGGGITFAAWAESCAHLLTFTGCALYYLRKEKQLLAKTDAQNLEGSPISMGIAP